MPDKMTRYDFILAKKIDKCLISIKFFTTLGYNCPKKEGLLWALL